MNKKDSEYDYDNPEDLIASLDEPIIADAISKRVICNNALAERLLRERTAASNLIKSLQRQLKPSAAAVAMVADSYGLSHFRPIEVDLVHSTSGLRAAIEQATYEQIHFSLIMDGFMMLVALDVVKLKNALTPPQWGAVYVRIHRALALIEKIVSEALKPVKLSDLPVNEEQVNALNAKLQLLDEQRYAEGMPLLSQILEHEMGVRPFVQTRKPKMLAT